MRVYILVEHILDTSSRIRGAYASLEHAQHRLMALATIQRGVENRLTAPGEPRLPPLTDDMWVEMPTCRYRDGFKGRLWHLPHVDDYVIYEHQVIE